MKNPSFTIVAVDPRSMSFHEMNMPLCVPGTPGSDNVTVEFLVEKDFLYKCESNTGHDYHLVDRKFSAREVEILITHILAAQQQLKVPILCTLHREEMFPGAKVVAIDMGADPDFDSFISQFRNPKKDH